MPTGYLFILVLVLGTPCQFVIGATSASTTLGTSTIEANSSGPPYSNASSSYSYDFHPAYPDCNNHDDLSYVGDGHCETDLNTASCGWDGGDCCVCTCTSTAYYDNTCPDDDRDCEDPLAPLHLEDPGCQNISFQAANVARCLGDQVYVVINDTAGATALAEATLCSGGYFEVEWIGHVDINKTIHVLDGTRLHIKGISNAVADGGGTVQIFLVHNASLNLNNIEVFNGASSEGGAIILAAGSNLLANDVAFKSNTAYTTGGAVYAKSSSFELVTTTFSGNSAGGAGGAIYADGSEISLTGTTLLERNKAFYGGALYLDNGAAAACKGVTIFKLNQVIVNGGGIGAANGGGSLSMSGTTIFTKNTCGGNGGAIDLTNVELTVDGNVTFKQNYAVLSGGALYASHVDNGFTLTGAMFLRNSAKNGGAVFFSLVGTDMCLTPTSDNEHILSCASIINGCRFDGNSASSAGGAIHSSSGRNIVLNTSFVKNSAGIGGGMSISGTTYLINSSFVDNKSGEGGGPAIFNYGIITEINGLFFSGNKYTCASDEFVYFEANVEDGRYGIVCNGCNAKCEECTIEDDESAPVCSSLLAHTQSEDGTATLETLELDRGYWRATTSSEIILACFNKGVCLGGVTGSKEYCLIGYEGPCEQILFTSKRELTMAGMKK